MAQYPQPSFAGTGRVTFGWPGFAAPAAQGA